MIQRFSKKRQAIYDCLSGTTSHPTADWIYHQLHADYPDLSLGTVYRNLSQLKDAGLIQSVGVINGQEHFDDNVSPHTHLICQSCGTVRDLFEINVSDEIAQQAANVSGYQITGVSLRLMGLCPSCKKKTIS